MSTVFRRLARDGFRLWRQVVPLHAQPSLSSPSREREALIQYFNFPGKHRLTKWFGGILTWDFVLAFTLMQYEMAG